MASTSRRVLYNTTHLLNCLYGAKMMTDPLEDFLRQADLLSDEQLLRLSEELRRRVTPPRGPRSVLELQGLGKALWAGVDADQYVIGERESWNG